MAVKLTTNSTIRTNSGGIDVTIYEDVGNDGTGPNTDPAGKPYDNAETVSLSGGTETFTLNNLDGSSGNAVWPHITYGASSDYTQTSTLNSVEATDATVTETATLTASTTPNATESSVRYEQALMTATAIVHARERFSDMFWGYESDWDSLTSESNVSHPGDELELSGADEGEAITDKKQF